MSQPFRHPNVGDGSHVAKQAATFTSMRAREEEERLDVISDRRLGRLAWAAVVALLLLSVFANAVAPNPEPPVRVVIVEEVQHEQHSPP